MESATRNPDRLIRTLRLRLADGTAPPDPKHLPLPDGITHLAIDASSGLVVTYDLRHANLPAIERWLAANGLALSNRLFHRLRHHWIAFTDDNRRDQASIVHQCCSVSPRRD